jgi:hypothetical protein
MRNVSRTTYIRGALGVTIALGVAAWAVAQPAGTRSAAGSARLERGQYLVTILACGDCHTPFKMGPRGPEPDASRALSGHPADVKLPAPPPLRDGWAWVGSATNTAFAGPWGVSYAPNLTPDATGLGQWTEAMFVQALRTGKHAGVGRPILPPMPWPQYARMTDDDLKAVFAALRATRPIKNAAPPSEPAPPQTR